MKAGTLLCFSYVPRAKYNPWHRVGPQEITTGLMSIFSIELRSLVGEAPYLLNLHAVRL